ncbi:MAG TPA: phosphatase PAP2 family protein [Terriglobales bacterium]|nr:phosphatase PAP2 family protein [Terriglobales bacterium]
MLNPIPTWLRAVLAALVVIAWLYCAVALRDAGPYLGFAIAGMFAIHLRSKPSWPELGWTLFAALGALSAGAIATGKTPPWSIVLVLSALGLASFLVVALRAAWSEGDARKQRLALLAPGLVLVFFVLSVAHALNVADLLHPQTLDLYLYKFDASLGFDPAFAAGALFRRSPLLAGVGLLVYLSLPLAIGIVYAGNIQPRATRPNWFVLEVTILTGLMGWALYMVFPGTGPMFVFGPRYPFQPLAHEIAQHLRLEWIAVAPNAPRNAMPSLHMAWVLLVWWNSLSFPRWARILALLYVAGTVFSTLGLGEHYLVDLVVAFPFALSAEALAMHRVPWRRTERHGAFTVGLLMTFAWFGLLRFGDRTFWISPAIPWILIVLTIGTCMFLVQRLLAAADELAPPAPADLPDSKLAQPVPS